MTERTLAASPHLDDGLHQQSSSSTQVYIYMIFFRNDLTEFTLI
jgi:hypothetical protein